MSIGMGCSRETSTQGFFLRRAWLKYGQQSFRFVVVEIVSEQDKACSLLMNKVFDA
jgi:hypothetical protein